MKNRTYFAIILLVLGLFWGWCQEETHHDHSNSYHLSAFGGLTTNYKGKQGYKLGIEYEYRLSELIGIGGTFDFTGKDFNIFAFSVGTAFYPFDIPLIPAIGVGAKSYDKKWNVFFRSILAYEFHINSMSIGPMMMYDFFPKEKNIMSYGLTVGFSFD